jgi:membrane protein
METLKRAVSQFSADGAFTLAAALSFYLALSLAPLVMVAISVAGLIWGRQAASQELVREIQGMVGPQGAQVVQAIITSGSQSGRGVVALVLGIVATLFGATGVFVQLQYSLNRIWNVTAKPGRTVRDLIRARLLALAMVLGSGVLLLASLVLTAVLTAAGRRLAEIAAMPGMWRLLDVGVSFIIVSLLFAMIYKALPYVKIRWNHVWLGAFITGLLFTLGKFLIGLYLGYSSVGSAYGAAGSLIILLVWVYYSSLILFFGAELTQAFAQRSGEAIQPADFAMPAPSPG